MIYLVARAVPRISDEAISGIVKQPSKFDRIFSFLRLEKIDPLLHNFLEKFLRKMKLVLMKLDNIASSYLEKVKKYKSGNNSGNGNNGKNGEEKQNLFNSNIDDK